MQRLVSTRLLSPPQYKIPERDFLCARESQEIAKVGTPSLSGQHRWYLIRQLQNFRDGIRDAHDDDAYGQLIASMAKTLSDEQALKDVTAYVATLAPVSSSPTEAMGRVDKGRTIFSSCQTCHGQKGRGTEALGGPRLAGQHDWYLIRQLKNFKAGVRGAHEKDTYGRTMRFMAHPLLPDDQAVIDVVTCHQDTAVSPAKLSSLVSFSAATLLGVQVPRRSPRPLYKSIRKWCVFN